MKKTPLRRVSKKRARENRTRRRVLHQAYGDRPRCYACPVFAAAGIVTGCSGWADDGHELLSRARGGSIIDPDGIIPVGRRCHDRITQNPAEAEQLGLARAR